MQLLISTPLQILVVNPATKHSSILRAGDGYYFGITHKDGTIVLSHSGGYLQYYDPENRPVITRRHLIQPHQIEWIEDKVLVTNTGRNCLSVFDDHGKFCHDIYFNEVRWDDKNGKRSGNHFNSVHRIGERIFVVAHNYSRPSEIWELSWPELQIIHTIETSASWAHNIWSCEWGLLICNSKQRSLYDAISGKNIWQAGEEITITRGLAASEDYIFVGQSNYAERKERYWKSGGIWVIDRKTLKTLDRICLPGSGDVQEIRLVDIPDDCHNGQLFSLDSLSNIKKISPFIALSYELRKKYTFLQRNIFPMSQLVRAAQMAGRWQSSFRAAAQ
jgi:hypothetical protein